MANILVADAGAGLTADEVLEKLKSGKTYVYLARNLMPAQADAIMEKIGALFDDDHIDAVVTERQDMRQYPDGSASAALVGGTDFDGNGLSGVEAKFDTKLAGKDGERVVDVDARHVIIPGSARDEVDAVDGMDIKPDHRLRPAVHDPADAHQGGGQLARQIGLRGGHAGRRRADPGDGLLRSRARARRRPATRRSPTPSNPVR